MRKFERKSLPVIAEFVFFVAEVNLGHLEDLDVLGVVIVDVENDLVESPDLVEGEDQVQGSSVTPSLPADPFVAFGVAALLGSLEVVPAIFAVYQLANAPSESTADGIFMAVEGVVHEFQGGAPQHSLWNGIGHHTLCNAKMS